MAASCHNGKDAANPHQRPTKSERGLGSLLKNRERLRRGLGGWGPLRAAGLFPEGFPAPLSKVSTFSLAAPRLVEKFRAALPARVLQKTLSPVHRRAGSGPRADAVQIPV
jgi:hypothetical protein